MKASEIEKRDDRIGVSVPKVIPRHEKSLSGLGSGIKSVLMSGKASKVKPSDVEVEKALSNEKFAEMILNEEIVNLLNADGNVVKTTSKMCGDNEFLYTVHDRVLRIWKGGISVFEDGSTEILFHRPHIVVEFDKHGMLITTSIHKFELISLLSILNVVINGGIKSLLTEDDT